MRALHIKHEFLEHIIQGRKTCEVRVGYPNIRKIKIGEQIRLASHSQELTVRVQDVREYLSFSEMLASEDAQAIAPDISTKEQLMKSLREIYPEDKEMLGVIVLEIKQEKDANGVIDNTSGGQSESFQA